MNPSTTLFSRMTSLSFSTITILAISLSLSGCLGPKKIDKWVATQYGQSVPEPVKKKTDYISVASPLVPGSNYISTTENKTSKMLPLVFYWQFNYDNTCTLNPQIPVNNFTNTVLTYNSKQLKQKLNGRRIELSVDKIPNVFSLDDKGHVVWIIYAVTWEYISIQPKVNEMVVSYKIIGNDNTETKTGVITIQNTDKGVSLKAFQSIKKMTWQYLEDYDASITAMTKKVVDKLAAEL